MPTVAFPGVTRAGRAAPPTPGAADDGAVRLRATGVTVRYGPRPAVADVSLELAVGHIVGLLGPNGAGKTSLLRRLAGLLPGTAGTVSIDGTDPAADPAARRRVGYLAESPQLYPEDTALQHVTYMAALSGLPRRQRREAATEALERAGAGDLSHRLAGRLSKGQRQRVALAGAIVHQPDVLLLDEPSEGLDPNQLRSLRTLLTDLKHRCSVLLSTHLLAEAQAVCDSVLVMDRGAVVLDRPVAAQTDRWRVVVEGQDGRVVRKALLEVGGVIEVDGAHCRVESRAVIPRVAAAVCGRGWSLAELSPAADDLEAAFISAVTQAGSR